MNCKIRKPICAVVAFFLLLSFAPAARAEKPEDAPEKGTIAASSLVLNNDGAPESSHWENVPVSAERMMIGLCYDETAPNEVSFRNLYGRGFLLGSYDEERVFHQETELDASEVVIRPERKWHLLFHEVFSDREEALAYALRNGCTAVELNGEHRVFYGSFSYVEEVEYLISTYGFDGSPWQDDKLGVYTEWGQLLTLLDGGKDVALEPIAEGKAQTLFNGRNYYGGFLLHRDNNDCFTVINVVDLEDYVKGVIPYEMDAAWPMEALKAQAVCARTYAAYNLNDYEEYGFDLTDDAYSQVYRGTGAADQVTDMAVEQTRGQFIRYHGELCEIYYFSSDGGATEDGANVFDSDRPYLAGKTDPFEEALEFAVIKWERLRSREYVTARLREEGYEIGTVVKVEPEYSELGNVIAMRYVDENGASVRLEDRDCYAILTLDNCRFSVKETEEGFLFTGRGWGHNCGMSQWGAYAMASVYGCDYRDIICFYFTGAYIG